MIDQHRSRVAYLFMMIDSELVPLGSTFRKSFFLSALFASSEKYKAARAVRLGLAFC